MPGAYIPVERQLINGDCNKTIVAIYPIELRGRVIPKADPDVQGYEPHFAYCSEYKRQERVQKSAGRKPIPLDRDWETRQLAKAGWKPKIKQQS